jgi:hypothetical protein
VAAPGAVAQLRILPPLQHADELHAKRPANLSKMRKVK